MEINKASDKSDIYYKLAMGQAVWTSLELKRRLKSHKLMRFLFNKPPVPESWVDYCFRFKQFRSGFDNEDFAAAFLKFALFSGSAKQYVVLGTQNEQHIREALKIEQEPVDSGAIQIIKYEDLWANRSSPSWNAHNG